MDLDLDRLTPAQTYSVLTQTLVPRPVAWVLSLNENGSHNLAPFSYFNAVCADPPLIMLSIGIKPDGSEKDTRVNIRERSHFVVHIASRQQARSVTESSATLPAGESELIRLGLAVTEFDGAPLPRLLGCRIAYACHCHEFREIGNTRQALILGRVDRIHIDDSVLGESPADRLRVDAAGIDPIGRLGGSQYVTFGVVLDIPRPP